MEVVSGLFQTRTFGHGNILKYCKRISLGMTDEEIDLLNSGDDFRVSRETIQRHDSILIDNINKYVNAEDTLIHLGDFCFGSKYDYVNVAKNYLNRITCKNIHLVWGNHDRRNIGNLFKSTQDILQVNISGQDFFLCHYAMAIWNKSHRGTVNLYGHSHSGAEEFMDYHFPGRRSMDVGIDNVYKLFGEYRPISYLEVLKIMKNRKGVFFDHHKNKDAGND